jgi:hypothetical protein
VGPVAERVDLFLAVLGVVVGGRKERNEDGTLRNGVGDGEVEILAAEKTGIVPECEIAAAGEQQIAESVNEVCDPARLSFREGIVIGVGVADKEIVFETRNDRHWRASWIYDSRTRRIT